MTMKFMEQLNISLPFICFHLLHKTKKTKTRKTFEQIATNHFDWIG